MITLTLKIPEQYIKELDELVKQGIFTSRSEAVRFALRELIRKEKIMNRKRIYKVSGP
ncbi:MAG: ribbon-helix-helix domain-containing protein [Thermoprotei archaeon]|jgi:Arc/MetJ-type ribon-helix-helix transcriptional regulator